MLYCLIKNEYIQENISEQTQRKFVVAGLVALPVAAAMYSSGSLAIGQVPQALTSGIFSIGLTVMSWAIAAKLALKLRK